MADNSLTGIAKADPVSNWRGRERLLWLLIVALILLRTPFLGGIRYLTGDEPPNWLWPTFEIGTYALTSVLIWMEAHRLSDYHIDKLALAIFVLGKPVELVFSACQIPFEWPARSGWYALYLPLALGLVVGLGLARHRLAKLKLVPGKWIITGALVGIALGLLLAMLIELQSRPLAAERLTPKIVLLLPLQQMMFAGINEEPLFRGFLWGALRRAGRRETWIWVTQAGLFWLSHLYYWDRAPLSFWVIVPLGGLVLGWLAWRSRSIATSMIAHGLTNGVGQMIAFYSLQ